MELRVLRYFQAVARWQNISKAAEELHITQPTLSRQLRELEEELGKELLLRGKRETILTPEGRLLLSRAAEMLELEEKTLQDFRQSGKIGGSIALGAGEAPIMSEIARIATAIQREHPQVTFHCITGDINTVTEQLEKGLLDFGLVFGDNNLSDYNSLHLPVSTRWGALLPKSHPLAQKAVLSPQDLWEESLIFSRQALTKNELGGWLQRPLDSLHIHATCDLIRNAAYLVEAGMGLCICFEGLLGFSEGDKLTFRLIEPVHRAESYLCWKKHHAFSPAAALFLKRVTEWSAQG